jgi:hypothetical protein
MTGLLANIGSRGFMSGVAVRTGEGIPDQVPYALKAGSGDLGGAANPSLSVPGIAYFLIPAQREIRVPC